tara:strand:- start:132 stop:443 length:312 start_codon:yes stop_codon:yes gene_type:complete
MIAWFMSFFRKRHEPDSNKLAFDNNTFEELDLLVRRGGHATREEALLHALTVYKWSLDSIESGMIVAKVNELDGTYRELSVPSFAKIKDSGEILWATWDLVPE